MLYREARKDFTAAKVVKNLHIYKRAHELPHDNRIKLFFQINKNHTKLFFTINTFPDGRMIYYILISFAISE